MAPHFSMYTTLFRTRNTFFGSATLFGRRWRQRCMWAEVRRVIAPEGNFKAIREDLDSRYDRYDHRTLPAIFTFIE